MTKKRVPFSVLSAQEPIDKKGLPFSFFANQCNSSLMLHGPFFDFAEEVSFAVHQSVFGILNRLDIDKKGLQNQIIAVW